jgi:hypothetical protein
MLGKAGYPALDQVLSAVEAAGAPAAKCHYIDPAGLPMYEGTPVPDNIFTLGVALGCTRLAEVLDRSDVEHIVHTRWKKGAERNRFAFRAGLEFSGQVVDSRVVGSFAE